MQTVDYVGDETLLVSRDGMGSGSRISCSLAFVRNRFAASKVAFDLDVGVYLSAVLSITVTVAQFTKGSILERWRTNSEPSHW